MRIFRVLAIVIAIGLMAVLIKGDKGANSPLHFQTEKDTRVGGPFESTNSNGRYVLTEAIVDYGTFTFTEDEARFAAPDLTYYQGKFFSIFTPGVSFMGVPLYLLGKQFDVPQLTTYLTNVLLALFNVGLIVLAAKKLGSNSTAALVAGLTYLLGTNALVYAFGFTQHHASVFFMLLGLLNAVQARNWFNNFLFGVYYTAALMVDVPNAFMMLPLLFYIFHQHFAKVDKGEYVVLRIKTAGIALALGLLPLLGVFGWYNLMTTGSPTSLAQMIGRSDYPPPATVEDQVEVEQEDTTTWKRPVETPFETRLQLGGLIILLFSDERAWWYYSPVVFFGLLGMVLIYRSQKNRHLLLLSLAIMGLNILLYIMVGDPWGGWSFGPRYLIPSAALLCIFIAPVLEKFLEIKLTLYWYV